MLDDPSALLGALLALSAAVLFGWSNVSLRRAGEAGRGRAALATSFWFAAGLVVLPGLVVAALTGRSAPPVAAALALGTGALSLAVGRYAFFEAVTLIGPSRASMVKNASPVLVVVLAGVLLDRWPTPLAAAGIAAIVVGLVQHGLSAAERRVAAREPGLAGRGLVIALASAAVFAVGDVVLALAIRLGGDPLLLGALVLLGGWLAAVAVAPGSPLAQLRALRGVDRSLASASVALGVGRLLSFVAIGLLFVPYVSAIVGTAPILTAVIGRIRGGADEVLTARLGVTMVFVVAGGVAIAVGG